jgi:hypothetical protein
VAQEQQGKTGKAKPQKAKKATVAGRGGARLGAGRKTGSGAFGEATVPMRVPLSLAPELGAILESFKADVGFKKDAALKVSPLNAKALRDKAAELVEIAGSDPSGKPVDVLRVIASHPESCYAWTAQSDQAEWGIRMGDTVVIDRAGKVKQGCLAAFWQSQGVELLAIELDSQGIKARKAGSKKYERQAQNIVDLQVWGIVVGIVRKVGLIG